jgi:hypothetical protein
MGFRDMLSIPAQLKCTGCPNTVSISLRFASFPRIELCENAVVIELDSIPTTLELLEFDPPPTWTWKRHVGWLCPACTLRNPGELI